MTSSPRYQSSATRLAINVLMTTLIRLGVGPGNSGLLTTVGRRVADSCTSFTPR